MALLASNSSPPHSRASSSRKRWIAGAGLVAALVLWRGVDDFARAHLFLINRSPSLPNWAYFVERGALPARGQVAFFLPPRNALVEAHFGKRPSPFGKIALGMPGDVIEHRGDDVVLIRAPSGNDPRQGTRSVIGHMKPLSAAGEVLAPGPVGRIPEGCYYMGSAHKDGFDSRYAAIGFVCRRQIVGVARGVLL
ncbi:S26 family signal peptidase [Novosphingobium sp. MD-1]|uniref:S26 family signal peptidase n=1 Tax=Novosphingobium sp. MD-1 TaxID=1630648 RepID=UPI00061C358F|nr:S26 family signal peptidase [Novosphingobium sp. MD-1]GAO52881.1 conjugative signal peptidase trhF [Novosphingobium sp. MD-1]